MYADTQSDVKRAKCHQEPLQPANDAIQLRRRTGTAAHLKLTGSNYVGSRGLKFICHQQYNYFDPTTGLRLTPRAARSTPAINDAGSNYNSIQRPVTRQFSHGLFFAANYVYGKKLG